MITGAHDVPAQEPISAEVSRVDDHEQHALDRLRTSLHERALDNATKAQGVAELTARQVSEIGGDVAVLKDARKTVEADLKVIQVDIASIKDQLVRSPVQQFIYSTAATLAAIYFGVLLYRIATGAG